MFDFLSKRFSSIFSTITGKSHLTEKNMADSIQKVQEALLEADVPYELVDTFIADIQKEVIGQKVLQSLKPGDQFIKVVHERLKAFLGNQNATDFSFQLPATVMVMGLQGSGKTTTVAKMAYWAQQQAKKRGKERRILLASVDFYRPAAIDQLEILATSIGVSFYRSSVVDPVAAAQDITRYAKKELFEIVFLDTAGRLHVDNALLQELRSVEAIFAPRYKFLVIDGMTGQESLAIAQAFEQGVGYQYAVLTKMDSETRGGVAFAFRYSQKKPIIFVGTGEKVGDLDLFHPERMAGRILGMGDVLTLIEKAESTVKQSDQEKMYKNFMQGRMTLQDFAQQIAMVNKLGSLGNIAKYLPGIGNGAAISQDQLNKGEVELKKFQAVIGSMTNKERLNPSILDGGRKARIAKGAGVAVADVNLLLKRFEESQQYAKLFKRFMR